MTYGWKLFPSLTPEQTKVILEDLAEKMGCYEEDHYESDQEQQRQTYFEIAGV